MDSADPVARAAVLADLADPVVLAVPAVVLVDLAVRLAALAVLAVLAAGAVVHAGLVDLAVDLVGHIAGAEQQPQHVKYLFPVNHKVELRTECG